MRLLYLFGCMFFDWIFNLYPREKWIQWDRVYGKHKSIYKFKRIWNKIGSTLKRQRLVSLLGNIRGSVRLTDQTHKKFVHSPDAAKRRQLRRWCFSIFVLQSIIHCRHTKIASNQNLYQTNVNKHSKNFIHLMVDNKRRKKKHN